MSKEELRKHMEDSLKSQLEIYLHSNGFIQSNAKLSTTSPKSQGGITTRNRSDLPSRNEEPGTVVVGFIHESARANGIDILDRSRPYITFMPPLLGQAIIG